jgi:ABC-type Fe3+-hydroxamate transport system substrate-binding protein
VAQEKPSFVSPDDDLGRKIQLKQPARRVVVVGPGAAESLFAIGAGKTLVGRDQIVDFPRDAMAAPIVGDYLGPYPEKVAALRPDLVIVQGETYDAARADVWQTKCGAPVAILKSTDLEGVASSIEKIGSWTGTLPQAARVADKIRVAQSGTKPTSLRAVIEVQRSPFWTVGSGTLVGDVVSTAFVNSPAVDFGLKGYKQFGMESLYAKQPDVYIVTDDRPLAQVLADLRADPALSKLKCVQQGQVLAIDGDLVLRPGPRLVQGIAELNKRAQALAAQLKKKS